ncbi:unnamed protein product [Sphacelaria rigidula]
MRVPGFWRTKAAVEAANAGRAAGGSGAASSTERGAVTNRGLGTAGQSPQTVAGGCGSGAAVSSGNAPRRPCRSTGTTGTPWGERVRVIGDAVEVCVEEDCGIWPGRS